MMRRRRVIMTPKAKPIIISYKTSTKESVECVFFDEFIEKHYAREIKKWKRKHKQTQKQLTSNSEIFNVIQKLEFEPWDMDKNQKIDQNEFRKCFERLGYTLDERRLKRIFDTMTQTRRKRKNTPHITVQEYKKWREMIDEYDLPDAERRSKPYDDLDYGLHYQSRSKKGWFVFYDDGKTMYHFTRFKAAAQFQRFQFITGLRGDFGDSSSRSGDMQFKWAKYETRLKTMDWWMQFDHDIPNGEWTVMKNQKDIKDIGLIFALLHHYYMLNVDPELAAQYNDDTPLRRRYSCECLAVTVYQ
eukprot:638540_1